MEFGHLMYETWQYKNSIRQCGSPAIDHIYTEA